MANSRLCSIPDCGKPHYGHGWCPKHYKRWSRHGDPLAGRVDDGEALRFYREVVLAYDGNECMPWPYSKCKGYGRLFIDGKTHYVSRLVCEEIHGPAPTPGHEAAHSCGRGHEACVTKGHLSWKTRVENQADRIAHGTSNRGERHPSAKITEEQARAIYALKGKLTQQKIADQLGATRSTVEKIHSGNCWGWLLSS